MIVEKYLFKGKSISNGEWVIGNHVHKNNEVSLIVGSNLGSPICEVFTSTVGMWNGLEDDYGAYFFEGDVIECWDESAKDLNWGLDKVVRGVLVFEFGRFQLRVDRENKESVYLSDWLNAEKRVVVGNIHDAPQLQMNTNAKSV